MYGILQAGVALTFSSESSSVEIPRSPQVGHRHRKYYKTPRSPHIPFMAVFILSEHQEIAKGDMTK